MAASRNLAVHWFRRDLRVSDTPALHHAAVTADSVLPVYILSGWQKKPPWTGPKRPAT